MPSQRHECTLVSDFEYGSKYCNNGEPVHVYLITFFNDDEDMLMR